MSGRPVLSVVMPVHNPGKYLVPCIDSVLGQTLHDFELIAIDDASKDGSLETLRAYAANDSRVTALMNETNLGAAQTRNRGLDLAQGEYVIFLDADDFFDRTYFADAIAALERTDATMAISPVIIRDETAGTERVSMELPPDVLHASGSVFSAETFSGSLFQSFGVGPFNKLFQRRFLLAENLRFQDLPSCNDFYFGYMVLVVAPRIVYLTHAYAHYRFNWPGQISARRGKHSDCILMACKKVREALGARGKWLLCRRSFLGGAVENVFSHLELAEHANVFLAQIHEMMPYLGLSGLTRKDFYPGWMNDRVYAMYRLICTGDASIGRWRDIAGCFLQLLAEGQLRSAYWLAGHYVKRAARRSLGAR